jgi:hypothetical protein
VKQIRKVRRYSRADWRLLAEAALLVGATRLELSILPFKVVLRRAGRAGQRWRSASVDPVSAERVAWAVSRVSRFVPGASCLTQALATRVLLSRRGFEGRLRVGVAKADNGKLEAHAWIERDGVILIGDQPGLRRFVELPTLDPAGS